jgi:uridine phosphorylase
MKQIGESELILNNNGSVYHLHLRPEHIADTIILVGDQGRVQMISDFFDEVEFRIQNREFITHTGRYKNKRITVLSTGIGTDNIDIVINELDALVNIDLKERIIKKEHKSLNFIRIGTSGTLQSEIPVDSFLLTKTAVGFDGLLNFYADRNKISNLEIETAFIQHTGWNKLLPAPYFVEAPGKLFEILSKDILSGMTISAPGFYGPQGRVLRLPLVDPDLNKKAATFEFNGMKITNFEMEGSAIYGLSTLLGHSAATICLVIANRAQKAYSSDYKIKMKKLILFVLNRINSTL